MQRRIAAAALVAASLALTACQSNRAHTATPDPTPARLFDGAGDTHRAITTSSPEAQRYFDQGLMWTYAFNHDEAIRSFTEAARLDPNCAMAWWGVAFCHGPHINNPAMTDTAKREAWAAIRKAQSLKSNATPAERALIEAVSVRYAENPPDDRTDLNKAYAEAMRRAHASHPGDVDITVLYADALLNLQPWDLWTKSGDPKGNTMTILALLESALRADQDHVGANHLYIHAVEASPNPEKGIASADRLRNAAPISGHLTHMPSHIDVQVGAWPAAAETNRRAIKSDQRYEALVPNQGFYRVYMAHNHHFLSFTCMMQGRRVESLAAARDMVRGVPEVYIKEQGAFIDPYMNIELAVMMRFGMWDELIASPQPPKELPITRAMWRFTRTCAYAAKGDLRNAERERRAFLDARNQVPADAMMAINKAHHVLDIAENVLDAEIAYRRDDIASAVHHLRAAIKLEDDLLYMEPPEWIQPVRHTLGAILVEAGRYSEAEALYREDLEIWPENGWSLFGLSQCLAAGANHSEHQQVEARFRRAWASADTPIKSTCLCVTGD
ncbi:MAG: hypothetical protein VYC34_00510 [Planctomycetota bacterium]|nr:hypothetical protein [Planctomycetota bacterium]